MDLQKLRQDFRQFRHDVSNAVEIKNKVEVDPTKAHRLGDLAKPFKHHAVAGKYLRYKPAPNGKGGKLYSKAFSTTELLARLGDKPSRAALKQQSQAAMAELAKHVDRLSGVPGTAERIGLTSDHAALTSRHLDDLDYHAAAAVAMHELGVCHDASAAQRDPEVQALKARMRAAVKADAGKGADLKKLAQECAKVHFATDVKELKLAREAMHSLAPNFQATGDTTAILQIKLAMRPLMDDPAHPMTATEAARVCAVKYHSDLATAETMLASMGLIALCPPDAVQWPGTEALQVVASSRRQPLSNSPQAVKLAVLRFALGKLQPAMDDNAVRIAANQLAVSSDFPDLDDTTWALIKTTHARHQMVTPALMRQTRLDDLLKEAKPDLKQRRTLLKHELCVAANDATDPAQAFSVATYVGRTMAKQANAASDMATFLGTHLPLLDGLIGSLPVDLTQHDADQLRRDTVQAFGQLFQTQNLHADLPPRFRKDLRIGIAAINASNRTPAEKKALKTAWRNEMLARYVMAPAIERYVIAQAGTRADARTAAVLLRQAFLRMIDGPTDDDRARMDRADLAAWEQCLRDWRRFLSRAGMSQDNPVA